MTRPLHRARRYTTAEPEAYIPMRSFKYKDYFDQQEEDGLGSRQRLEKAMREAGDSLQRLEIWQVWCIHGGGVV